MKKNSYLSLGVMSGTSNDGIDISLIQSDGKKKLKILGSMYIKYNNKLTRDLNDLTISIKNQRINSSRIIDLQDRVTMSYIHAIKKLKLSLIVRLFMILDKMIFETEVKEPLWFPFFII